MDRQMEHRRQHGFSLVELSIVLVILGLLVGGVLGGQSLIHAAELRTITTDAENYRAAIYTFRNKYHALPGDNDVAERLWGSMTACPPADGYTPSPPQLTCDGNTDGELGPFPVIHNVTANRHEWFTFWQHLANAGLIDGQFTGVQATGTAQGGHTAGVNCPQSRFNPAACWGAITVADSGVTGDTGGASFGIYPAGRNGNMLLLGIPGTRHAANAMITPEDMWNVDSKFDDGMPDTGVLIAGNGTNVPNCRVTVGGEEAYNVSNQTVACSMAFRFGF